MELFDSYKKQKAVWRDSNGNLYCPGDACPRKCDDGCPIWCHTMAVSLVKLGHEAEAIKEYKKAVELAPDFKEAWNNLGVSYGRLKNHMEANQAFRTAYAIDSDYENVFPGLINSYKNIGQFDEALKYCDEYAVKFDKAHAEELRKKVITARDSGTIVHQESVNDMAFKILDYAKQKGLIPDKGQVNYIPELNGEAKATTIKIFQEVIKYEEGKDAWIWFAWSAYAGMGAVYHWHIDWPALKAKGIAETLLEPRGAFAMDEYVIDTIGIGFETPEGKVLSKEIQDLSVWAAKTFVKDFSKDEAQGIVPRLMQSMFIFGMNYEMEKLKNI